MNLINLFIYLQRELNTERYKMSADRKYAFLAYDTQHVSKYFKYTYDIRSV